MVHHSRAIRFLKECPNVTPARGARTVSPRQRPSLSHPEVQSPVGLTYLQLKNFLWYSDNTNGNFLL
jgi:hypothetical protein